MNKRHPALVWETELRLFSRRMLVQWSLVMLLTALVMVVIVGTSFVATGDWDDLLPLLAIAASVSAGLWLLGLMIMAVLFRGHMRVRYTLDDRELRLETIDRRARAGNRLAMVAGLLARSPQTFGAGLIARSQETMAVRWRGAFRAEFDPARHYIGLRNEWRTLLAVQCTPGNYAEVEAAVKRNMAQRHTDERVGKRSPLPAYLLRTALVVLATLPLFMLADEYDTGLFLPILILCFALATVWMINLFGWVVIAGLLAQIVLVIIDLLTQRESVLFKGERYYGFEVLAADDYSLLLIAAAGAGALIHLSLAAIRGRWLSALLDGYKDMG